VAQADIARWEARIKKEGLLKDRGEGGRDWVQVGGSDGTIFELRLGAVYMRAVFCTLLPAPSPDKPFAFWRMVGLKKEAQEGEEEAGNDVYFPKNLFIGTTQAPLYLSSGEVERYLFEPNLVEGLEVLGPAPVIG
jgi:hypothetical protein